MALVFKYNTAQPLGSRSQQWNLNSRRVRFKKTKRGCYFTPANFRGMKKSKRPHRNISIGSDYPHTKKRVFSCVETELPAPTPTCPVSRYWQEPGSLFLRFPPHTPLTLLYSSLNSSSLLSLSSSSDTLAPSSPLWPFAGLSLVSPQLFWTGEPRTEHSTPSEASTRAE